MKSPQTRALAVASVALATLLSASPAHAQDADSKPASAEEVELSYKEYAKKGGQAFAAKEYEKAVEAFERAYELKPVPNLLYNIGRALEKVGEFERAKEAYTKFVTQPDVELRARQDALQRIKTLQEVIALRKSGEAVDAAKVDEEQGEHQLADTEVPEGDKPGGGGVGKAGADGADLGDATSPDAVESTPTAAYILMGTGAAALVGSGVFGYLTYSQNGEASDAETLGARRDAAETGQTYAYLADGMLVGGVILAGLGTYLWLSAPVDSTPSGSAGAGSTDESPQARVAPSIGANGAALTFTLDF